MLVDNPLQMTVPNSMNALNAANIAALTAAEEIIHCALSARMRKPRSLDMVVEDRVLYRGPEPLPG